MLSSPVDDDSSDRESSSNVSVPEDDSYSDTSMPSYAFNVTPSMSAESWTNFYSSWDLLVADYPLHGRLKPSPLEYILRHVFCGAYYPSEDDYTRNNAHTLARAVHDAACAYYEHIDYPHMPYWLHVIKMLENLKTTVKLTYFEMLNEQWRLDHRSIISQVGGMQSGEWRLDHRSIISQVGGMQSGDMLVFTAPRDDRPYGVIFWNQDDCTLCELLCPLQYPAAGIYSHPELAIEIPNELLDDANFSSELADSLSHSSTELLSDMLCGVGPLVEPKCITKRHGPGPTVKHFRWSRSYLWFVIKAAIQSFLARSPLGDSVYKAFMLFFMCNLAGDSIGTDPPSILLHSMSAKILRRFRKLGSSAPHWLCDTVSRTCTSLSCLLNQRWENARAAQSSFEPSSIWDFSRPALAKDIHLSLPHIHEYISKKLANRVAGSPNMPFPPNIRLRGTLYDFLSHPEKFLSHPDDFLDHIPGVLHYIEWAVGDDMDDWVAHVTDVDEACEQLEYLVHQYQSFAWDTYGYGKDDPSHPDHLSGCIMLLTIIEFWVALDKLLVKEIPILADYSPEIPVDLLSGFFFLHDDAASIRRLSRVYQYLSSRHCQAQLGWSVFSNEFTNDSFPCRYYDSSPLLQRLKARIEDTLLGDPVQSKIMVFELQCPVCFDMWRSITCWIAFEKPHDKTAKDTRIRDIPALQPHMLASYRHIVSLYPRYSTPRRWVRSCYLYEGCVLPRLKHAHMYQLPSGPYAGSRLQKYVDDTVHTSNEVLAAQADCDPNLSLHEFISFGHLRSGGSLQWFNILRELRSRTLDFRRREVYLLLTQASAQVGPLDSTGVLLWHQELQDPSFCHTLLEELERLFTDVDAGSLDGPGMAVISLLAGVLASRSLADVTERAIRLLRKVRGKTFDWVQELLYNARDSPANQESLELLRDMATICRSTFSVGMSTSHEQLRSVQDIEIALSCAMLIRLIVLPASSDVQTFSKALLNRDRRLSLVLEGSLRDAIQADTTDLGVDRAVQLVWPGYRPGTRRWEPLPSPNAHWLVCETVRTQAEPRTSQTLHVNLLDGSLLVDGKQIGNQLSGDVTSNPEYRKLFYLRDLMVVPSDLPDMDFVTMTVIHSKHRIHFAVRNDDDAPGSRHCKRIVIRAQNTDTNDIFELLPLEIFQEELPKSLIEGHIHWLNLSTSVIEIRPIEEPWKQSPDNWTICLRQSRAMKGGEFLVNMRSPTWAMVSNRFRCLDSPENLMITASLAVSTSSDSHSSLRLSISLPRYCLSFFVNEVGHLESVDFKNMVYDEDQCIGTLFGLVYRLVLRPKCQIEANVIPRCVIIPHTTHPGRIARNVLNQPEATGSVRYHTYQVDTELGCMKGAVSLESRLHLAFLHVLTGGGFRPDPLIGRTGIEEALSLVWLAGTRKDDSGWCPNSHSPQICFAAAKIQGTTEDHSPISICALLQEAYLFPSEIASSITLAREDFLNQLFHERPVPQLRMRDRLTCCPNSGRHNLPSLPSTDIGPLRQLFSSLRADGTAPAFQSQYISRLHSSAHDFQTMNPVGVSYQGKPSIETLREHYVQCRIAYTESLDMIKTVLSPKTDFEQILDQCGQWPRVTPFTLFRRLSSTSPFLLPDNWKKCLIPLALLALDVQRARRLLRFSVDNLEEELFKELENEGCDGWDPAEHPDWLLIQLQGDFLIRRVQADVANQMISPRSGKNTVMQVNMGEGKTSVIIPICAAALADGNRLVRIVVPKALVPQTTQILTDRLCGLVNKPIYHLSFTRKDVNEADADSEDDTKKRKILHMLILECRNECGVVVMQPEHVLSLKLACIETQLLENGIRTNSTQVVQRWGFEHVLNVLTDSLWKPLTGNTFVSTLLGGLERLHRRSDTPEIPPEIEWTDLKHQTMQVMWTQNFLEAHARDILDECDDVLRPQSQLIYAIGQQHAFEGSPGRWVAVQQVLELAKQHAYLLSAHDSYSILRCDGSTHGSFPHIHTLQAEGGEQLVSLIAHDVLDGRLSGLEFHSESGLRGAIREFILHKDIHPDTAKTVENYARQSTSWGPLLLLRGLLAHNILLFALTQRRWRVDYGLDPCSPPRTMLAIPYRAKDVPAEAAEFGHPDITILLTCLSYYYGGLSEEQLGISFELLLQQDDPSSEYALWIRDCDTTSVPSFLLKLSGVNTRSVEQWTTHFVPLFSRNKKAIDLYLSKIVFPNHAKEFPQRILGSYWDIAEQKSHLVTGKWSSGVVVFLRWLASQLNPMPGFSGTNDGQYLLPTSIVQDDPHHLQQTGSNAKVLTHLLQPENSSYMVIADESDERWTTLKLLGTIVAQNNPEIRVLLDVGAQILDLTNLQLVKAWLDCTSATEVTGAIYFSEDDKLMVLARNGTTQPLSSSALAQHLHRCVVYLDDAHTRGTDLKFPLGFRAAVTLGHKVTKDRLVQGCMRMRKLGYGHSVMFFAPREVDQKIRVLVGKENPSIPVTTNDILHWTIHETWGEIQRQALYWAQQGMSHQSRYEAWSQYCQDASTPKQLADTWVQQELKSLADMYLPSLTSETTVSKKLPHQIRERCENLGVLSLPDVRLDEEQEREVSREIEREREVERPPIASPATHSLHPDIINLVRTGIVPSPSKSKALRHIFAASSSKSSGGLHSWSPDILATADFCETVEESESVQGRMNDYLRPIQWVLSGKMQGRDALVILSPFEADLLMPEIRISKNVRLHLYIPRTTKRMKPADDLRLYSVPPLPSDWVPPWSLIDQLNVFAGQLYLSDYTSYVRFCGFLGIHTDNLPRKAGTIVARNRFLNPDSSDAEIKNRFEGTPLPLVMQLLAVRRGMDFAGTHMGRILEGWPLSEDDF